MPKYSFIVPVYKVESFLPQCIDSILSQDFSDFELLLINDGSPDGSGAICDSYSKRDQRISVIHKKNEGVSIARNVGIDAARGEFVIFVDSDDWVDKRLLAVVDKYADDYEIIFFGHSNYCQNGDIISFHPRMASCFNRHEMEDEIFHLKVNSAKFEFFGYTWNKVFRSSVIKRNKLKFAASLTVREDELFTMDFCQHISTLKVVSESLYNYRYLNAGLSSVSKSSDEILIYANSLKRRINGWGSEKLRSLDRFRYAISLLNAAYEERNIIYCIQLTFEAYKIKKKTYEDSFKYAKKGPIRYNLILALLFHIVHCFNNIITDRKLINEKG
mgnify:CR=1 FL=1